MFVTSEVKVCPDCGTRNKGKFPKGMDGKVQYGNGVKATIINLSRSNGFIGKSSRTPKGILGRFISRR